MKLKKRFLALIVAVIAILTMTMTTIADSVKGQITGLSNGDTVKYAQIIELNATKTEYVLTSFGRYAIDTTDTNLNSEAKVLAVLVGKDGAQTVTGSLAKILATYDAHMGEVTATATANASGVAEFDILPGAYIAQATAGSNAPAGTIYTPLMLVSAKLSYENGTLVGIEADGDTTVAAKKTKTGVDKVITDDSNDVDADGNEIHSYYASDNDIVGKTVNYQITVDVPDYPADSTNHTLYIYDKFSEGIDFVSGSVYYQVVDKAASAPVDGNWVQADFDGTNAETANAQLKEYKGTATAAVADFGLFWNYDNLHLSSAKKIFVKYQGTLNSKAVVGVAGNPNKVTEVYSDKPDIGNGYKPGDVPENPSAPGAEESHQNEGYNKLEDTEKVYTYGFYVVKRSEGENPDILVGATFDVYTEENGGTKIGTFTTNKEGIGGLAGIPAGKYWLEETVAPKGYSKLTKREAVETAFVYSEKVTTTTTVSSWTTTSGTTYASITDATPNKTQAKNENGELLYILNDGTTTPVTKAGLPAEGVLGTDYWKAYVVSQYGNTETVNGETKVTTNETIYGDEGKEGTAKEIPGYQVKNSPLGALPSTGGVGTLVFTFSGVVLMILGAAIFLVIRKKRATM